MWPIAIALLLIFSVVYVYEKYVFSILKQREREYAPYLHICRRNKTYTAQTMSGTSLVNSRELGRGAYGVVLLYNRRDVGNVARKVFFSRSAFRIEAQISAHLRLASDRVLSGGHYNEAEKVNNLMVAFDDGDRCSYLDFPLAKYDLGVLLGKVELRHAVFNSAESVKRAVVNTLEGLQFLHDYAHLLHNDIKPSNMLYCANSRICLADFGMAQPIPVATNTAIGVRLKSSRIGTITYQAPEVWIDDLSADTKPDIFSLAVSLYQVFEGVLLINANAQLLHQYNEWQNAMAMNSQGAECAQNKMVFYSAMSAWFSESENINKFNRLATGNSLTRFDYMPDTISSLLRSMMALDPSARPTATEALTYLQTKTASEWIVEYRDAFNQFAGPLTEVEIEMMHAEGERPVSEQIAPTPPPIPQIQPVVTVQPAVIDLTTTRSESVSDVSSSKEVGAYTLKLQSIQGAIESEKIQIARILVKKARVFWKRRDGAEDLRIWLSARSRNSKLHDKALKLFTEMRGYKQLDGNISSVSTSRTSSSDGDGRNVDQHLSDDEMLIYATLCDEKIRFIAGAADANRIIFQMLTKRSTNWWKKRASKIRAKLIQ